MAQDLATLSLSLTNAPAIAAAKATGAAFEEMGVKGERAALKLVGSSNPVTDAIRKQAVASVEATRGMNAWSAIQAEAAGHVGSHSLAIGRLERNLATVAERALGVNSTVGLMGSSLLKFGIGSIETVGILAGIAAIAAAWEYFTGAARKAREENDKLRESLESGNFQAALGPSPDLVLQTNAQRNTLMQERERRRQLVAFGAKPDDQRIIDLNVEIAHSQSVLEEGERRLFKARMDATTPLEKVVIHARDYTAEMEKQQALLIRYNEMMKQAYGGTFNIMDPRTRASRASDLENFHLGTMSDAERAALMKQSGIGVPDEAGTRLPASLLKLTVAFDAATSAFVKLNGKIEGSAERIATGVGNWKGMKNIGMGVQAGVQDSVTNALEQFSPEALTSRAVTAGLNYIVQGFTEMATSMLDGGAAAKEYARALRQTRDEYAAAVAQFKHDDLAAALAQNAAATEQLIKQAHDALGDASDIIRALNAGTLVNPKQTEAELRAQETKNAEIIRRQAVYAQEDLAVRNLRATGQGSQADLLAFREQQQREMQKAIDANKDALYLNTLQTTQNNELLAFQNGLLSTAIRNAPTGSYGIEGYLGRYATPRGYPTDSGVNPVGPNPTGGLTPPGGRGPITIVLKVDGKVLTTAVVSSLDQTGAATNGAGSSRSDALNVYR